MVIAHEHRLDAVAVAQLPEVFDSAVEPGNLLAGDGRRCNGKLLAELFSQGLGEIVHLRKVGRALMEPGEHLLAAEGRLAHRAQRVGDLLLCHGFDIGHRHPHSLRVMRQM